MNRHGKTSPFRCRDSEMGILSSSRLGRMNGTNFPGCSGADCSVGSRLYWDERPAPARGLHLHQPAEREFPGPGADELRPGHPGGHVVVGGADHFSSQDHRTDRGCGLPSAAGQPGPPAVRVQVAAGGPMVERRSGDGRRFHPRVAPGHRAGYRRRVLGADRRTPGRGPRILPLADGQRGPAGGGPPASKGLTDQARGGEKRLAG